MQIILTKNNSVFTNWFTKSFDSIDKNDKQKILQKLNDIFVWKSLSDIKKLRNFPLAEYRLRIWNYQILFTSDDKNNKYLFTLCTHRKNLY